MDIQKKEITDAESYLNFVREFVTLLDKQFLVWEQRTENNGSLHELALQLPALISLVNTVGYLRGQDGMFLDIRPRTENQQELYGYEDLFESRLRQMIKKVLDSTERQLYVDTLSSYYIKTRTNE